jgi:hypothetical protein
LDRKDSRKAVRRAAASSPTTVRAPAQSSPASAPASSLTVLDREPGAFLFGQWKNVTILAWSAIANAATIARLKRALSVVVGSHPEGRSTVSIIAEGLPLPTPEARIAIIDLIKRNAGDIACIAVVVNGSGFGSSALRGAHTDIRAKSTMSYDMGVLGSLGELKAWLPPRHLKRTQVALDPAELESIVQRAQQGAARDGEQVPTGPPLKSPP